MTNRRNLLKVFLATPFSILLAPLMRVARRRTVSDEELAAQGLKVNEKVVEQSLVSSHSVVEVFRFFRDKKTGELIPAEQIHKFVDWKPEKANEPRWCRIRYFKIRGNTRADMVNYLDSELEPVTELSIGEAKKLWPER